MDALLRVLSLPAQTLSKVPGIGPLVKAYSTTVGQKILMALSGLSLCGFLIAHLGGNLKLYAGEQAFNDYAHALHSLGPLLAVAEVGLFAMFALHIGLAISTSAMNVTARKAAYFMKESKQGMSIVPGGVSSWMMVTGIVIAFFLVCHILDMKLRVGPGVNYPAMIEGQDETANAFQVVSAVLATPSRAFIYCVALIALGLHLSHGVRSAFQTLGISHKRWNVILQFVCISFAWAIALGFMSLVFWALSRG